MAHPQSTRTESEISLVWARNNPALFVNGVSNFKDEHPIEDWKHLISMHRNGFITLIAQRREQPFDHDRDYLREIGQHQG